jgi:hypothetical protein
VIYEWDVWGFDCLLVGFICCVKLLAWPFRDWNFFWHFNLKWCLYCRFLMYFPILLSSLEYISIPNLTALLSELCNEVLCWPQISAFVDFRFHRLREHGCLLLNSCGCAFQHHFNGENLCNMLWSWALKPFNPLKSYSYFIVFWELFAIPYNTFL